MEKKQELPAESDAIRLNRFLAQCGLGARRKCDELIESGHVFVNGEKVRQLGTKVFPADKVEYRGTVVKPLQRLEYWAYFKPRGVMVTKTDPEGRPTLYQALAKSGFSAAHLNYIGRLDYLTDGLLLLTNDGSLIHALTHPRYQIKKVYAVQINRLLHEEDRGKLLEGITSEGQLLRAGAIKRTGGDTTSFWYEVTLYEGKNRQLRRMFEALTYQILHLRRTIFASVKLGDQVEGTVRPLTEREVAALKAAGFPSGVRGKK
jgi:23S rRNA pseudouridine2605 synthase